MPVTWNPSDKGPNLTLSGGDLTVTAAAGFYDQFVRATESKTTGKWVFSAVMNTADYAEGIGLCNSTQDLTDDFLPLANAIMAMRDESQWKYNGTTVGAKTQFWASGTEIMIAVDADARTCWMSSDGGTTWYGSAAGSPAAGTNGQAIGFTGAIFPTITTSDGRSWVGRFTDADIAGTIPSGFSAWDSVAVEDPVVNDTSSINVARQMWADARGFAHLYQRFTYADPKIHAGVETPQAVGDTAGAYLNAVAQHFARPWHPGYAAIVVFNAEEVVEGGVNASVNATLDLVEATDTLAVTVAVNGDKTLDLVTQAANATVGAGSISASANQTLDLVTAVETAAVRVSASATQTLDLVTAVETAAVRVSASATQTLALVTQVANANVNNSVSASANQTLDLVTVAETAAVRVSASAAQTLDLVTVAETAAVRVSASATQGLALPTQTTTVTITNPAAFSAAQTLVLLSSTATATLRVAANGNVTLPGLAQLATVTGPTWGDATAATGSWTSEAAATGTWTPRTPSGGSWT